MPIIHTLPDLIRAAIAHTTRNKYERARVSWADFCRIYIKLYTTTDTFFVATYFKHLLLHKGARDSINDAFYEIIWGNHSSKYPPPPPPPHTDNPFIELEFEGAVFLGAKENIPLPMI